MLSKCEIQVQHLLYIKFMAVVNVKTLMITQVARGFKVAK